MASIDTSRRPLGAAQEVQRQIAFELAKRLGELVEVIVALNFCQRILILDYVRQTIVRNGFTSGGWENANGSSILLFEQNWYSTTIWSDSWDLAASMRVGPKTWVFETANRIIIHFAYFIVSQTKTMTHRQKYALHYACNMSILCKPICIECNEFMIWSNSPQQSI